MPRGKTSTSKKSTAARANGAKASASHTLRAATRRLGQDLTPKQQRQVLDDAARYRKARADREEAIAAARRRENAVAERQLIPVSDVRSYLLKVFSGLRREIDQAPLIVAAMALEPAAAAIATPLLAAIQGKLKARLGDIPELIPDQKEAAP